ncbi:MAG: CBS domain-containing protein [Gammaproteobacteria bacterium]|nr:CBS domain-containing protein [Gammaproteobacteria bacterium]MYD75811.1 CBS domain-containing protein [Gammaproteobacteria bacterium]MYJ52005.1 CBS domain-containing protein [Gammaproteobacteria bacterium]
MAKNTQNTPRPLSASEISPVTPLHALTAVSLDTETTGLDTARDRIIQIGGIRISRGVLDPDETYNVLVNPGIPIPEVSRNIHGISDGDVAHCPAFCEINEEFNAWIGDSVVVGHSIGFDLAMLKRESELAGLAWKAPRTIDVRHLVDVLAPKLPEYSLDAVASWLGIPVTDRHDALADARVTASVFLALLSRLREQGIRTLAELENACREADSRSISETRSGWYDFLYESGDGLRRHTPVRIDSYPYQHRVSDVMSSPASFANPDETVSQTLSTLMQKQISSMVVSPRKPGQDPGIITERDILRAIDGHGVAALDMPIGQFATFPLTTLKQDEFLFRAVGMMDRLKVRHLGVEGPDRRIVGMLTSRDLIRQKATDAINIGDAVHHARTEQDLASAWANLSLVAIGLDRENVDVRNIASIISEELRALTRRCCMMAEQEMAESGMGPPPVPYAMLVLGSGGRGESLLAMDQDNAIVYLEGEPGSETDQWFERLGRRTAELLNNAGVPYCKGHIMASNPEWRMDVSRWKSMVAEWISRTRPEDLLKTDIFFDAVSVHGDESLMEDISRFAFEAGASSRSFLSLMATNAAEVRSPLSVFGRFKLKDGRMDVKMGGILPIFSAARVESIRHGITVKSTPERLNALIEAGKPAKLIENLAEAHRIILTAILKQQLYDLEHGISLSNRIAPEKMKPALRNNLRWALEQVPSVTDLLGVPAK